MVSPEVPTCWPVGQAILDHQPHRQVHHAVGVLTTGWGEIREVRVKVLATLRTVEFIPIKPLAATDSSALGSCAGHSRVPSPGHGPLASTGGFGPSRYDSA